MLLMVTILFISATINKVNIFTCSIDSNKALDHVKHDKLIESLYKSGVNSFDLHNFKNLY